MKLKRLFKAILTLDNGDAVEVRRLGKGRYTEAWKAPDNVVYLKVKDGEYSKEILANLTASKQNNTFHIPQCVHVSNEDVGFRWYKMPLYFPLTASNKRAWSDFKALSKMREEAGQIQMREMSKNFMAFDINNEFNDLVQASDLSPSIKEAVDLLVNEAVNYGEYLIEITKKNCAVDDCGNLILLDPLFDWDEVKRANKIRQRKYQ